MDVASSSNKPQKILQPASSSKNCSMAVSQDKKKEMELYLSIEHKQQVMQQKNTKNYTTEELLHCQKKYDHVVKQRKFEFGNKKIVAACTYYGLSEIKLINSIRKHQDLYNQSHIYRSRKCLDAWEKVAIENDSTAENCREAWKLIRRQYVLYERNIPLYTFYLAEHMDFIKSYTMKEKEIQIKNGNPSSSVSTHLVQMNQSLIDDTLKDSKENVEYRIQFLMSMLSDLRNMNYSQMSEFKKRVYKLIDETLKIR